LKLGPLHSKGGNLSQSINNTKKLDQGQKNIKVKQNIDDDFLVEISPESNE